MCLWEIYVLVCLLIVFVKRLFLTTPVFRDFFAMSLLTANWNYLGEEFYKKFEICQMLWNATISLGDYQVSMAPFGGPIGMPK